MRVKSIERIVQNLFWVVAKKSFRGGAEIVERAFCIHAPDYILGVFNQLSVALFTLLQLIQLFNQLLFGFVFILSLDSGTISQVERLRGLHLSS